MKCVHVLAVLALVLASYVAYSDHVEEAEDINALKTVEKREAVEIEDDIENDETELEETAPELLIPNEEIYSRERRGAKEKKKGKKKNRKAKKSQKKSNRKVKKGKKTRKTKKGKKKSNG